MQNRYLRGCFFVALSAVIFGCMPLVAKSIYAEGVNSLSLVFFRNFLPLPVLFLMIRRAKVGFTIPAGSAKPLLLLALSGSVVTPVLLFTSYLYISSGTATTLHFSYPIFVVLGCAVFLHEPIRRVQIFCVLLCTGGMLAFYTPGEQVGLLGMALAFASGITYAFYIIYLARSGLRVLYPFYLSFLLASTSAMFLLPTNLLAGGLRTPVSSKGWLLCLLFSLMLTVVATVLFQVGTFIIGPQRAAILSTFEPITSIIIGVGVLGEAFHWKLGLGAALILASVVVLTLADQKALAQSALEAQMSTPKAP